MELRKRPRPPRVDPNFVSSPPPLPPRKRARRQAAPKKPREARKRPRCAGVGIRSPVAGLQPSRCDRQASPISRYTLPRVSFIARHPFNWYEPDMWTEVAKYLHGWDLVRLSFTCRWFRRLLADDSIWRYAFIRDLSLPADDGNLHPPRPLHRSWRLLYSVAFDDSHSYCFRQREKHIEWFRIGGFLLDTRVLLTGMLAVPRWLPPLDDGPPVAIQMTGACALTNARPGIWIADFNLVRCPVCNINSCTGTMQVLDARHCELYLEESFRDGTWEYEDLGDHFIDEEAATAACAIFNGTNLASHSAARVVNAESWIRTRNDLQPKACLRPYAVAVNTNLQSNQGLLTRFQVMRDMTRDGQIVSIRITQQLF